MKYNIEIQRLAPQNNQPHKWSWQVLTDGEVTRQGVTSTKKDAILAATDAVFQLQSGSSVQ